MKMKFKHLPNFRQFRVRDDLLTKIPTFYTNTFVYNCIDNDGNTSWCADNFEVTLADSCESCIHYKGSRFYPDGKLHGFECDGDVFETERADDAWMSQNPTTFTCSNFEEKKQ